MDINHNPELVIMEAVNEDGNTIEVGEISRHVFGTNSAILILLSNPVNTVVSVTNCYGITMEYSHPKLECSTSTQQN